VITLQLSLSRDFGRSTVFTVQTSKTFYQVVVNNLEAHVIGPGVDESYSIGNGDDDISDQLSREGQAAIAIILWEESK
jgi:tRNA A58 N-methylase Trm61